MNYCLCYACIKLLHMGILIWLPYYIKAELKIDNNVEGLIMILYGAGGIIGGVFAGILSDKVVDRSYVVVPMLVAAVPMINVLNFILGKSSFGSFVVIFVVGALISGGSNLVSAVVAADMCDLETQLEAKSTLTGVIDASGGIGASFGQFIVTST